MNIHVCFQLKLAESQLRHRQKQIMKCFLNTSIDGQESYLMHAFLFSSLLFSPSPVPSGLQMIWLDILGSPLGLPTVLTIDL